MRLGKGRLWGACVASVAAVARSVARGAWEKAKRAFVGFFFRFSSGFAYGDHRLSREIICASAFLGYEACSSRVKPLYL